MNSRWQVGIDIGGTFTDVVAFQPSTGEIAQAKVRSHPDDAIAGLLAALEAVGIPWERVDDLMHGSTLITNAIVEDRLAEVALIATEGFADTLAIGRQNRRHLYRLDLEPKARPQVPERLRFEVAERLDVHGDVLTPLTRSAIDEAVRAVADSGVEAVAVSFPEILLCSPPLPPGSAVAHLALPSSVYGFCLQRRPSVLWPETGYTVPPACSRPPR